MNLDGLTLKELYGLRTNINERIKILEKEAHQKAIEESWEWVKGMEHGETLYCCASGTFLGGPLQRGDKVKVHVIQPRKGLLWIKTSKGKIIGFNKAMVNRYKLRPDKPDKPGPTAFERRFAARAGKVLEDAERRVPCEK